MHKKKCKPISLVETIKNFILLFQTHKTQPRWLTSQLFKPALFRPSHQVQNLKTYNTWKFDNDTKKQKIDKNKKTSIDKNNGKAKANKTKQNNAVVTTFMVTRMRIKLV